MGAFATLASTLAFAGTHFFLVLQMNAIFNDPFNLGWPTMDAPDPRLQGECTMLDTGAVTTNLLLWLLWGVQHSGMARPKVKEALGLSGMKAERGIYGCVSILMLVIFVAYWKPVQDCTKLDILTVPLGPLTGGGLAICWGVGALLSGLYIKPDHFFGFGGEYNSNTVEDRPVIYEYPYSMVRHPASGGFLAFVWGFAAISQGNPNFVFFAAGWTVYVLIGTQFEEMGLRREFGQHYDEYATQVPAFFPKPSFFLGERPAAPGAAAKAKAS